MSHVCDTRVCHVCKSKKHAWHQAMCVQTCKMNAPQTHTYTYTHTLIHMKYISSTKQSSLQLVGALSSIIHACRNIFGGIVTDLLGHPRHTAFEAACS